jgi:hypothetical protein
MALGKGIGPVGDSVKGAFSKLTAPPRNPATPRNPFTAANFATDVSLAVARGAALSVAAAAGGAAARAIGRRFSRPRGKGRNVRSATRGNGGSGGTSGG